MLTRYSRKRQLRRRLAFSSIAATVGVVVVTTVVANAAQLTALKQLTFLQHVTQTPQYCAAYPDDSACVTSSTSTTTSTTKKPASPTGKACDPGGQAPPTNNQSGWKQIFVDDFCTNVPLGAFSGCGNNPDPAKNSCSGLKAYGAYYKNWGAYPSGWPDTAKAKADGNTQAPFGGVYEPQKVVSVSNGAMHINQFRPAKGGDNQVATVVPLQCVNREYGMFTERFKVVHADPGFKSAHLFYQGGHEIDYPENDWGQTISAYTHPDEGNFSTKAKWTGWHTTTIKWTSSSVEFFLDGKSIGKTTKDVPHIKMTWILQNESSILGPYAKPGAKADMDIDWVSCYAKS